MSIGPLETIHGVYVHGRRCGVLATMLADLVPPASRVLDVGCGDGQVAHAIEQLVSARITGIDTQIRPDCRIPAFPFDGEKIPYPDRAFDVVMFVDVLHHADDPLELLCEGARVASRFVLIKDHLCDGPFARQTLAFMDRVGNARHGVASPGHYLSHEQWMSAFTAADLRPAHFTTDVPLYPFWASWLFGRRLHFIGQMAVR